jgi:hypothetical protein
MEPALPSTSSYPAYVTQLKRGIRTLAARPAETMQTFTALHRAATRLGALDAKTEGTHGARHWGGGALRWVPDLSYA